MGVLQVSQALSVALGGSPDASVAEVVAKLTRAKAGRTYASPREALLLNVKFVISQLQASGTCSAAAPFIARIQSEVRGNCSDVEASLSSSLTLRPLITTAKWFPHVVNLIWLRSLSS